MANIKIFVSNRIDVKSKQIKNDLYVPVRCGAVYDDESNGVIIGDDTGDNISIKRNSFCEFTVQYWAWKNVVADYYGLCHYRRFLTFSDKKYETNIHEMVMESFLDNDKIKKYELNQYEKMKNIIESNDVIFNDVADVSKIITPNGKCELTVYNHWMAHSGIFFNEKVMPIFLDIIKKLEPQMYAYANQYFNEKWHRGFNCYIMKKEIFDKLCQFQFPILFELERVLKDTDYEEQFPRTIGYFGEMLYGIFSYYLMQQKTYKIKEVQLVYFEQTEIPDSYWKYKMQRMLLWGKLKFENISFIVFPKATKRRQFLKNIYLKLMDKN